MYEGDLDELSDTDLLSAAGEFARIQDRAGVRILEAALAYADRNAVVFGEPLPGCERIQVYGGDGCPAVAEFAPIEFGAVLRMSSGAAAALIGEALALRHRLPRIWAAVLAGNAVAWRARKIAHACLSLSLEAAAIVDRRVAGIIDTLTPGALTRIVTAAVWQADPDLARAQAEAAARTRGVFVAPSDTHGTKQIWVRAAAGDVIRFDATIDDLARALKTLGDPDTLNQRRAKAIGWIADPTAAHHLLQVARHLAHTQPTPTQPTRNTSPATASPATGSPATSSSATGSSATACPATASSATGSSDPSCDGSGAPNSGDPDEHTDQGEAADQGDSAPEQRDTPSPGVPDPAPHWANPDDWAYTGDRANPGEHDTATGPTTDEHTGGDTDTFTREVLAGELPARLAAIKEHAHSNGLGKDSGSRKQHTLYVHLTDHTLATGTGVLRVEELGPLLANQLTELLGHDQIIIKPVIDLNKQVNVHAYEIPDRIREQVRLRHPVDTFPYSATEATTRMDQDHITPYNRAGPATTKQTCTNNLIPLTRLHHRAKTFGGWRNQRLPTGAIKWTSPHGFHFLIDHTGTHPIPPTDTGEPDTTDAAAQ